jgi:hypothetical protein
MNTKQIAVTGDLALGNSVKPLLKNTELYCEVCKDYTEHEEGEITKCMVCGSVYRNVKRYIICGKPDNAEVIAAREALLDKEPDVIIIDEEVAWKHKVKGFSNNPFQSRPTMPIYPNPELFQGLEDMRYDHLSKRERNAVIEPVRTEPKYQRNEPCPCGKTDDNGKRLKYKKCCGKNG